MCRPSERLTHRRNAGSSQHVYFRQRQPGLEHGLLLLAATERIRERADGHECVRYGLVAELDVPNGVDQRC